jgi:hypothetical protein
LSAASAPQLIARLKKHTNTAIRLWQVLNAHVTNVCDEYGIRVKTMCLCSHASVIYITR